LRTGLSAPEASGLSDCLPFPSFLISAFSFQLSAFQPLPGNYAVRLLRNIRNVLAPNGSSSNAPAIIIVGFWVGSSQAR